MKHWLHDHVFRRLLKNASIVVSGDSLGLGLQLAALSLTARVLGAEQLGVLVLINTYVLVVDRLVNFQSWQALIKYGAECFRKNDKHEFRCLVRFGFTIDATTALLGTLLSALGLFIWAHKNAWDNQLAIGAVLYSVIILFRITGAPIAIIRLYDKFHYLSAQKVVQGLVKLVGVAIAAIIKADLQVFILIWALAEISGCVLLVILSIRLLHANKVYKVFSAPMRSVKRQFPGIIQGLYITTK